ncbi:putative dipeptidase B [Colletotrichum tanaceti]|uniref:Putative dipeptidase B n=1 Tax=Colletotrichum tanaceti TaxID=1306861 RepID=A0A4U6XNC5_9PEZI|nr:putative dipeptidase B [Colletotrichum tanaceti]TKW57212.1 putative dipeptidase B [Colletotrichum tanaceti]
MAPARSPTRGQAGTDGPRQKRRSRVEKLPRLPEGSKIQKRALARPQQPVSSNSRYICVGAKCSFMSVVSRVRAQLDRSLKHTAPSTRGLNLNQRVDLLHRDGGTKGRGGEAVVLGAGRAVERVLAVAAWFADQSDCAVEVRTKTVRVVDDVVLEGGEEEGAGFEDESRVRKSSVLKSSLFNHGQKTTTKMVSWSQSSVVLAALSLALSLAGPASASYAFYVGKDLTADGSVMVGGTGEEVSSHWLQLFPARDHAPGATVTVGVTDEASIPGERFAIPQAAHTYRYLSMEYSDFEGFPAPLTNGGLNENGVAVRDVWAPNREALVAMTPTPQRGVQYSDLARIVMERARTAREGVEIIGDLVDRYGEATYGGNTHLVADKDEGWVVWEMAGGRKLWAAERLRADEVRVLYPGYIEDFPTDFGASPDHMASDHIVSFAVEQGWWDPDGGAPFNIFDAYGDKGGDDNRTARDGGFKFMSQAALEEATRAMAPLTEEKLMERVRDRRIADDEAGYGQVVSLRAGVDPDLLRVWNAPATSISSPYVPWWLGVAGVPPEFGQHRYLTTGASASFLNPDYALQEASVFAGRVFKRVLYYMCSSSSSSSAPGAAAADAYDLLPVVTRMLTGFENQSRADIAGWVEAGARALIEKGEREAARALLTHYSHGRAAGALDLGRTINDALDGHVKLTGQWRSPPAGSAINDAGEGAETVNCLVGYDPDRPSWKQPAAHPTKRRRSMRSKMVIQRGRG